MIENNVENSFRNFSKSCKICNIQRLILRFTIFFRASYELKDFYYESYFNCLAYLSEWDELAKAIEQSQGSENGDIWNDMLINTDKESINWYFTAEIRNTIYDGSKKRALLETINKQLTNAVVADYFKNKFSEQLAFLMVTENNIEAAKIYVDKYVTNFITNWGHINPLLVSLRTKQLLSLQALMDIEIAINENDFNAKTLHWGRTSLDEVNNLIAVDKRSFYRQEILNSFHDFPGVNNLQMMLHKNLIKVAVQTQNYHIARKARRNFKFHMEEIFDDKFELYYLDNEIIFSMVQTAADGELDYKKTCLMKLLRNIQLNLNHEKIKSNFPLLINVQNQIFDVTNELSKLYPKLMLSNVSSSRL